MRFTITIKAILDRKRSTIAWSIGLFTFAVMFAAVFEVMGTDILIYLDSFPEQLGAFFGDFANMATPNGFLGVELYGLFLPLGLSVVGISFGASAIGKEEEKGTLELLLASPVSRTNILFQKMLALAFLVGIVAFSTWLGVFVGTLFFPFDPNLTNVFSATVMGWLLGVFYGTMTMAIQSATGRKDLAIGIGSAALAVGYFLDVFSKLVEDLDFLKYFSPFYYYNGGEVLLSGMNYLNIVILGGFSLLFVIISFLAFSKRDTGI